MTETSSIDGERWCAGSFYRIAHKRLHLYVSESSTVDTRAEWNEDVTWAERFDNAQQAREAKNRLHPVDRDACVLVHVNVVRRGRYRERPSMQKGSS